MLTIILSLLHADTNLNQFPDPFVDPRFSEEPGIAKTLNATFSYIFDFSGPSITDFQKFSPNEGTALLDSPLSAEHKFIMRLPIARGFQLTIKPMFRTNFNNKKKDESSIDRFESMNLGFDISKELFDNNIISYSAKLGSSIGLSVSSLVDRYIPSPSIGHSLTFKKFSSIQLVAENSFITKFFTKTSTVKNHLEGTLLVKLVGIVTKNIKINVIYDTKYTSKENDSFFKITKNLKHLIHVGSEITYSNITFNPYITLNAKNSFKNPSLNFAISYKIF
jgi:hypothetical protein